MKKSTESEIIDWVNDFRQNRQDKPEYQKMLYFWFTKDQRPEGIYPSDFTKHLIENGQRFQQISLAYKPTFDQLKSNPNLSKYVPIIIVDYPINNNKGLEHTVYFLQH